MLGLLTTKIGRRVIRQELPGVTLPPAVNTIQSKNKKDPTLSAGSQLRRTNLREAGQEETRLKCI